MKYSSEYNASKQASAEGGNRTLIPGGNTILSRARLPIPPLRPAMSMVRARGLEPPRGLSTPPTPQAGASADSATPARAEERSQV